MKLVEVMMSLYKSEINSGMQSFWDGGFSLWIGDEKNGMKSEKVFKPEELDASAAEWLDKEARKIYPDSEYAKPPS